MKALEICRQIRACWDALFLPRLVSHLETENASLRAKIGWFEQQLAARNLPVVYPENKELPKMPQAVGGVVQFWDSDARAKVRKELFPPEEPKQETQQS